MQTPASLKEPLTRVAGFWSEGAAGYADRLRIMTEIDQAAWTEALREFLPAPPCDVLDVGTGTGDVARMCAALGHRVTGIDQAEGMLAVAAASASSWTAANPPVFLPGDAHAPPFLPESFDVVVSRFLFWTLLDPVSAMKHWLTLLRPGGQVVALDSLWWVRELRDPASGALPFDHSDMIVRYSERIGMTPPLTAIESIDGLAVVATAAGFEAVQISRLDALERALRPVMDVRDEGRYPLHVLPGRRPSRTT
jgi:SAM-dependent methyltransferase